MLLVVIPTICQCFRDCHKNEEEEHYSLVFWFQYREMYSLKIVKGACQFERLYKTLRKAYPLIACWCCLAMEAHVMAAPEKVELRVLVTLFKNGISQGLNTIGKC